MQNSEKIIIALDHDTLGEAMLLVDKLGDSIQWYKVGSVLFTKYGEEMVRKLKMKGKKVFLDLKYHDIPNTVEKACVNASEMGVDMLTVHLSGGSKMIQSALKGANTETQNTLVVGISVLTSLSDLMLRTELNVASDVDYQVTHLVGLGLDNGICGIVCSPNETDLLRTTYPNFSFVIINPGIRMPGDDSGDQKRTATPAEAIINGANFIVVGRSVTDALDPVEKVKIICEDIQKGINLLASPPVPMPPPVELMEFAAEYVVRNLNVCSLTTYTIVDIISEYNKTIKSCGSAGHACKCKG
jgi:orotidine-5'-phosphate decarboxylase